MRQVVKEISGMLTEDNRLPIDIDLIIKKSRSPLCYLLITIHYKYLDMAQMSLCRRWGWDFIRRPRCLYCWRSWKETSIKSFIVGSGCIIAGEQLVPMYLESFSEEIRWATEWAFLSLTTRAGLHLLLFNWHNISRSRYCAPDNANLIIRGWGINDNELNRYEEKPQETKISWFSAIRNPVYAVG